MLQGDGLTVVIPTYNEKDSIERAVSEVRDALETTLNVPYEIIIVDDGSQDGTLQAAQLTGEHIIRHSRNRGYGAALKTGIHHSRFQTIGIIDADGTYPAQAFGKLLELLEDADMAVGSRELPGAAIPLVRRPAKWVLRRLAEYVTGTRIDDLNSGIRVFPKPLALQYFNILPDTFSFTTTITVAALCDGYRVVYHPIDYLKRTGKSKIVYRNFFDFIGLLLRLSMWFRPMRLFLPIGVSAFLIGFFKLLVDVAVGISAYRKGGHVFGEVSFVSTSALGMLIIGVQFLLIGMMAEMLGRRLSFGELKQPSRATIEIAPQNTSRPRARTAI
jgi:glycosyltransferase involved in cell wall biosynthesis